MNSREQRGGIIADLGVALERLWAFHQAMRLGRPVENAEESLAQLGTALKQGAQRVHQSGSISSHAPEGDPHVRRPADSQPA